MQKGLAILTLGGAILMAVACSTDSNLDGEESQVKIVNGKLDVNNEFPNVVLLNVRTNRSFFTSTSEFCTGVITDANTVIAAAHCVKNLPNNNQKNVYHGITTNVAGKPINATEGFAFKEPISSTTVKEEQVALDLVVLKFPAGSFNLNPGQYARLPDAGTLERITPGSTKVFLVGYGNTSFANRAARFDQNSRNYGENTLATRNDRGYYTVTGATEDTQKGLANKGDSGGPLFLEDRVTLIGIGSALLVSGNQVTNYFVDLLSLQSQNLLKYSQGILSKEEFAKTPKIPAITSQSLEAMCSFTDGLLGGGKDGAKANINVNTGE